MRGQQATYVKQYGLIGYPLGHSFSKKYFSEKFAREGLEDSQYDNFPIDDIGMLASVLAENSDLLGLNVTIPYKQDVLEYCDSLSEDAAEIQAVNTLFIDANGKIKGHNTDIPGFQKSLTNFVGSAIGLKALVLGSGGSSKAVRHALSQTGIEFRMVSRSPQNVNVLSYDDLDRSVIEAHHLVINTTPLGMSPHIELCPDIPNFFLGPKHFLFDLIYNPEETLFLAKGRAQGASIKNGEEMLILQAEASWEIWNNR